MDAFLHEHLSKLPGPAEAIAQLLFAAVAGSIIGLEREIHGRQAGFRTHLIVCVGSALVMIVSIEMASRSYVPRNDDIRIQVDPGRIAYSVMTGIGFLGAGTIIQHRNAVRGLTTAAALWCVAAMGLAAGAGYYTILVFSTVLIVVTLWLLNLLEDWIPKLHFRQVTIRTGWKTGCIAETVKLLQSQGVNVIDTQFERSTTNPSSVDIHIDVSFRSRTTLLELERRINEDPTHELMRIRM